MRLDDETYEEIKGEVARCIKTYGLYYPFSAFDLADKLGVKLIPYSHMPADKQEDLMQVSKDAFLVENGFETTIYYNDEMPFERMDMSMFHEIGHFILEHNHDNSKNDFAKESEAAFFAKYMKAPLPLVNLLPEKTISAIEKTFRLSHEATGYVFCNYRKWVNRFHGVYTDYETMILAHGREGILGLISNLMKEAG